ncbi:hypothetical protein BC830DRAFT_560425 [Chytriomyces sp. MP71]|nr:hypothetical protein BC830DRAFT_560425 [Chytriomyces sp. MP71]
MHALRTTQCHVARSKPARAAVTGMTVSAPPLSAVVGNAGDDEIVAHTRRVLEQINPCPEVEEHPLATSALATDALLFRTLAHANCAHKQRAHFDAESTFSNWLKVCVEQTASNASPLPSHVVSLGLVRASDLAPKDHNGFCNAYTVVSDVRGNVLAISSVVQASRSPVWELYVTIPVFDSSEPIYLSIWNQPSSGKRPLKFVIMDTLKRRDPDAHTFLGLVSLTGSRIIKMVPQHQQQNLDFEDWFPLLGRTNKSRVSGRVLVSLKRVLPASAPLMHQTISSNYVSDLYREVFKCIPPDPIAEFQNMLRLCLALDYKSDLSEPTPYMPTSLLSPESSHLLDILARYWFVDDCARTIAELEEYSRINENGTLPTVTFFPLFTTLVQRIEHAYTANLIATAELARFRSLSRSLHDRLLRDLTSFFDAPLNAFTARSPALFAAFVRAFAEVKAHPLLRDSGGDNEVMEENALLAFVDALVKESLAYRVHRFGNGEDGGQQGGGTEIVVGEALVRVALSVVEELQVFVELFDDLILSKLHIPTMAAYIYTESFLSQIESYLSIVMRLEAPLPLNVGFVVLEKVQELEILCERIDYRLQERFNGVVDWFRPFLDEFVSLSGEFAVGAVSTQLLTRFTLGRGKNQ